MRSLVSHRLRLRSVCVLAMPFATALSLVGPGMIGKAEGCSGAGPFWSEITWSGDEAAPSDAVVVLRGKLSSAPAAPAAPAVTLTDQVGSSVPGKVALEPLGKLGSLSHFAILFVPNAPLAPDATFTVAWGPGQDGAPAGQGQLTTTAAPGASPKAPAVVATFTRQHRLVGKPVTCAFMNFCDNELHFNATEIDAAVMELTWSFAQSTTSVYSVTEVQAVPDRGILLEQPLATVQAGLSASGSASVVFSDDLPQYCVRLATRDLTDQVTSITNPICVKATGTQVPTTTYLLDAKLVACQGPPNDPSLFSKWCALSPGAKQCPPPAPDGGGDASGSGGAGGTGGTGGTGGSGAGGTDAGDSGIGGADAGGQPSSVDASAGEAPMPDDARTSEVSGSGVCSVRQPREPLGSGAPVALVVGLALLLGLRRRTAEPRRLARP